MEIIGESAHRILAYVEAVGRQGHSLSRKEFNAYAEQWNQKVTEAGDGELARSLAILASGITSALYGSGRRQVESMFSYLSRVQWIAEVDESVRITALGKAVLREANTPVPDSDAASTLEVVIDPENPFAYAQLMAKIAGLGECMIVDPYLDPDQLLTLATFPSVTRILTSNYESKKKSPAFGVILASASASHLQLRMVDRKHLHDRIVMPSQGSALVLGSSLNSIARRFGVATPLEESSSRLILAKYDAIWAEATPIEPAQLEPAYGVTGASVDEGTGS